MRIILASASPRRRELLGGLLSDFEVIPSHVPEEATGDPAGDARRLALAKARAVAALAPGAVVVGADTIVHDGQRSYGKPADAGEAAGMLRALRGREHSVYTGLAVVAGGLELAGLSVSQVRLAALTDEQIDAYVASGRPLDKAGAYAIQDEDVPTVAGLEGCYCAVVGLPLWNLARLLEAAGVSCREPAAWFARCEACPERPGTSPA